MKSPLVSLLAAFTLAAAASAADANTYQVTGPILELTDAKIVVQKGKEKWELARTADTKVSGELRVGAKVTIQYSMTAQNVEVKADKAEKPAAKGAEKPAK